MTSMNGSPLGVESTDGQYLLCRNRLRGCEKYWRFDLFGREAATAARDKHEKECPYALYRLP